MPRLSFSFIQHILLAGINNHRPLTAYLDVLNRNDCVHGDTATVDKADDASWVGGCKLDNIGSHNCWVAGCLLGSVCELFQAPLTCPQGTLETA